MTLRVADHAFYANLLKSCKHLAQGREVHARILQSEHHGNRLLNNLLIEMYGKCGSLEAARTVFDSMAQPNTFSWNIIISSYAQHGHVQEASHLFDNMRQRDVVSWNTIIAAYAQNGHLQQAQETFDILPQWSMVSWTIIIVALAQYGHLDKARHMFVGMPQRDVFSWTTTVTAHAQRGYLQEARAIFDHMPLRNVVAWNAMVAAYAQNGHFEEAAKLFHNAPEQDLVSWNAMIATYAQMGNLRETRSMFEKMPERDVVSWTTLHAAYARNGHLEDARGCFNKMPQSDLVSSTAMVTGYALCGDLQKARSLFDEMPQRTLPSWNGMIAAYGQHGEGKESISLFQTMVLEGMQPDKLTFLAVLSACSSISSISMAKLLHSDITQCRLDADVSVGNALIDVYGKCGDLDNARAMFESMPERTIVSWTALISACVWNDHSQEAMRLFRLLDLEGLEADRVALIAVIDACASLTALMEGRIIHKLVQEEDLDVMVANAFLNMYAKCGALQEARTMFDKMPNRDVVTWTTMITAYAQCGYIKEALELFQAMDLEGIQPNSVTFVEILHMFSHRGRLRDAWQYFASINGDYGLQPTLGHYACMLDLLGRSGQLSDAEDLIKSLPFESDTVLWTTLLGACRNHGDVKRGARVAEQVLKKKPDSSSFYVLLSNMYMLDAKNKIQQLSRKTP